MDIFYIFRNFRHLLSLKKTSNGALFNFEDLKVP